jgi:hypothetical protein
MTINIDTTGAVFTKTTHGSTTIVSIELDGDLGLFFAASANGDTPETDRANFATTEERDEALANVVAEFAGAGYERVWA